MKNQLTLITLLLVAFFSAASRAEELPSRGEPSVERKLSLPLERQRSLAIKRDGILFGVLNRELEAEVRESLKYLLAYAPLSDLADYDGEFFLESARYAVKARNEMPWGKNIPKELYYHFVLPPRVNNENMDRFRALMYEELKKRVRNLSLEEAALEINHWCHEKVAYQSTDDRTSAPLSTIRSAFGRCGEESTLTVSALRTAGIPARQCYTPRWAHSDDNHAWVEVWVDGSWYFMGACEPEPVLNMGWFDGPAKRAMMVHTKTYGPYLGNEAVLYRQANAAMLNLLDRYTHTAEVTVTVYDRQRKTVPGADVRFQLFNYAEFYTLLRQESDPAGQSRLRTGLGDMLVWASKGDRFGFAKVSVEPGLEIDIELNHALGESFSVDLDFTPPLDDATVDLPKKDPDNERRCRREDEIRNRYVAGFIDENTSKTLAQTLKLDEVRLWKYLKLSRGNWMEIKAFLENIPARSRGSALDLLGSISEKDLRDTTADVLSAHLEETEAQIPAAADELFIPYLLNPRIADEFLRPYRQAIRTALPASLIGGATPGAIAAWIEQNIRRVEDDLNHYQVPLSPMGVLSLGSADSRSLNIFAVALCRSIGLPSRLEPGLLVPQVHFQGRWRAVWPRQEVPTPARLSIFAPAASTEPVVNYYRQFTIGRFQDGDYNSLPFPHDTPASAMPKPLLLPAGHYRLVTGVRMSNEDILTRLQFFTLQENREKTLPVILRDRKEKISGHFTLPPEMEIERIGECERRPLGNWIPSAGAILAFIRIDHEPSRHLLDDLARSRGQLESWGGSLILIPEKRSAYTVLSKRELNRLPKKTIIAAIPADQAMVFPGFEYPYCLFIDQSLSVGYISAGYHTGNDDQLLQTIRKRSAKE